MLTELNKLNKFISKNQASSYISVERIFRYGHGNSATKLLKNTILLTIPQRLIEKYIKYTYNSTKENWFVLRIILKSPAREAALTGRQPKMFFKWAVFKTFHMFPLQQFQKRSCFFLHKSSIKTITVAERPFVQIPGIFGQWMLKEKQINKIKYHVRITQNSSNGSDMSLIKTKLQQMENNRKCGLKKNKEEKNGLFNVSACVTALTPSAGGEGLQD